MMIIKTNNHERELISFADLPEKARPDFDYIEEDEHYSPRLFQYRGVWYDANEFMVIDRQRESLPDSFEAWHGYQSDSFFSGVLIRYAQDYEAVIAGTYYS